MSSFIIDLNSPETQIIRDGFRAPVRQCDDPVLVLLFIFYIGIARIVSETGLVALDLPLNSLGFLVRAVGSSRIDPSSLTTFGLANTFARNWKQFAMVSVSHITKSRMASGPTNRGCSASSVCHFRVRL
ncbi:MAG: DUF6785 family protein [Gemmatimonadota bacterium]|nr:DUF6785 family protein [Gemmatimonadota bacterium]